jgi:hypothetical protein
MDHQDQPVKMAPQEPMAAPAQLDPKDHPAQPVRPETMVLQAKKDRPAQTAQPARRVSVPNIAPPTAVSSSRMEQGDKRQLTTKSDTHPRSRFDFGSDLLPRFNNFYPSIVILLASMSFACSKQHRSQFV